MTKIQPKTTLKQRCVPAGCENDNNFGYDKITIVVVNLSFKVIFIIKSKFEFKICAKGPTI
jgi:hypothetical protein